MDFDHNGLCQVELIQFGADNMQYSSGDYSTHQMTEAVGNMRLGGRTQHIVDSRCQGHDSNCYGLVVRINNPYPGDQNSAPEHKNMCEPVDAGVEDFIVGIRRIVTIFWLYI